MAAKAAAPASAFESPDHQKAVEKFKKVNRQTAADANDAIAVLERRAHTATKEIDLPGGDVVKIYNRLSRTAFAECGRLENEIAERYAAGDLPGVIAASHALIGHVLYMEDMTPEQVTAWLNENPQSVSDIDAEEIILGYRAMRREELARLRRIAAFREE